MNKNSRVVKILISASLTGLLIAPFLFLDPSTLAQALSGQAQGVDIQAEESGSDAEPLVNENSGLKQSLQLMADREQEFRGTLASANEQIHALEQSSLGEIAARDQRIVELEAANLDLATALQQASSTRTALQQRDGEMISQVEAANRAIWSVSLDCTSPAGTVRRRVPEGCSAW